MATQALVDATTWVEEYDFTTNLNQINLGLTADVLDSTTFGSGGYRTRLAGLKHTAFDMRGYWESATSQAPDPQAFGDLGTANQVVTVANDDAEGSTAYLFRAGKFNYNMLGPIGELVPFDLSMQGSDGVGSVRGQVAKAKGNVTLTGFTGTAVNVGAVSSTQSMYATLHVFSAGTTITVTVFSDDNSGMTTPTARRTIGPITTAGGTWATPLAGPFTDTWWQFNVTAITGTFQIAGAIGIR